MTIPYDRWHKAIQVRASRRKYSPYPISKSELDALEATIAAQRMGCPQARVVVLEEGFSNVVTNILGSYGLITGASSFAVVIVEGKDQKAQIHGGYLGEALILEATALGLDTCWIGGFFDRQKASAYVALGSDEQIVAITPLGHALEKLTITERVMKGMAKSGTRKPLSKLCIKGDHEQSPLWIQAALKDAQLAPSAMNRQPWRFEVTNDDIVMGSALEHSKVGPSPYLDCGIALLHLMVGAGSAQKAANYELLPSPGVARVF